MKKEEKIKNLFVKYLEEQENKVYKVIGEDVKSRSGNKNFDYLLESDFGVLIALEITQVNNKDFDISLNKSKIVKDFLEQLHLKNKEDLPGVLISYPLFVDNERFSDNKIKGLLQENTEYIKSKFIEASSKKEVAFWIPEESSSLSKDRYFCHVEVKVIEGTSEISFFGVGAEQFNTVETETEEILKKLRGLIPNKNEQLDYEANKRILLIGDTRTYKFKNTLKRALNIFASENLSDMCNIDEVFIAVSENKKIAFQQIYKN